MRRILHLDARLYTGLAAFIVLVTCMTLSASDGASGFNHVTQIASTVPPNGDVNPYGVAVVPVTKGMLTAGNILVSNFNASSNFQGTGTTIVQITPSGSQTLFAQIDADNLPGQCTGGVGLTTALVALKSGFVIVGSLPTVDGTSATAQAGCLLVLDSKGAVVETFFGTLIDGPWDMTVFDLGVSASLFVTNVLNDTVAGGGQIVNEGTVVRVDLKILADDIPTVQAMTVIGSGFSERTDPSALVIGPTGVGLSADGKMLYVADSLNNRIAAIANPLTRTASSGIGKTVAIDGSLNDPLGLAVGFNGNILTVNGNNGLIVQTTPHGQEVGKFLLDHSGKPPGAGALFGLAPVAGQGIYFVDDATNHLDLFH
jgi:hypothetical protein